MPCPCQPGPRRGPGPGPPGEPRAKTLSPQERRTIFVHMVRMELEQGRLGYTRRRQLIRFAGDLGIDELEAALMVAETLDNFGGADSVADATSVGAELLGRLCCWPAWMKLSLAVGAALLVNFLLLRYLFA